MTTRYITHIVILISILFSLILFYSCRRAKNIEKEFANSFFVSAEGNDNNKGTIDSPFKSLEKARDAVRLQRYETQLPEGDVKVYIRGGVYERKDSFVINTYDSGTEEAPITYCAYKSENVVFTGGKQLNREWFTKVEDKTILDRIIDKSVHDKILQIDLKRYGISDYGIISAHGYGKSTSETPPTELYIDGKPMTLARWPNNENVRMGDIIDVGPINGSVDYDKRGGTFTYQYERPEFWKSTNDIWVSGIFGHSWEYSYNKMESIDIMKKQITLGHGEYSGVIKDWFADFHHFENLLEEIDMPGEYYIDRTNGILYLLPPENFNNQDTKIWLSILDKNMVVINDAQNLIFQNIIFSCGRNSGISMNNCKDIGLENCELSNFTNQAVIIQNSRECGLKSCNIHDIGSAGVSLNGGNATNLEPGNNYVENCHIWNFAFYQKVYSGAVTISGVGNRISNCEIHNAPHVGVTVFGNDHVIERNEIYDICREFNDMGCIYFNLGHRPDQRGTIIRQNYFHNIGSKDVPSVEGVYLDSATQGVTIYENIFYKVGTDNKWLGSAIKNNGGMYIKCDNNIFIDCPMPYRMFTFYLELSNERWEMEVRGKWKELLLKFDFTKTIHMEKYPELADIFVKDLQHEQTCNFEGNLIFNSENSLISKEGISNFNNIIAASNNWITTEDPGFKNFKKEDFTLKSNARVFKEISDFKKIPYDLIGIRGVVGAKYDK